ncbi:PAS domain-containing protein [Hyphomonas sp.]|uniref:PAS domain-containing protein n=1 Tax=Hyphomonas sp. TaxID=87 RepID=UPI001BCF2E64|nr:PAS domain-containing protein [Hyphomonas sp.]
MSLNALAVLSTVCVPVEVIDRDLRFVFANLSIPEVSGKSREDLAGKHVFDVFPQTPQRIAEFTATFERVPDGAPTPAKEQSLRSDAAPDACRPAD